MDNENMCKKCKDLTPNEETLKAIKDVKDNIDVNTHYSASNMFTSLDIR